MSKKERKLVTILRQTAQRIEDGARYEWGHMGRCNCGHLVQTLTDLSDREIVSTVDHQLDEWSEHAKDYCDLTASPVDEIFLALREVGFDHRDVIRLERLSDPQVLRHLGPKGRELRKNYAPDVSLYMRTMAELIESGERQASLI